ncbi:MAG TPA: peptidylprolyl isomerase [Longimicrobiales bacterium]|nr:peptidylprolyl isomerase [Longimicrobiales bacterium]
MTRLVATAALLAGAVSFTACDGFGQAMTSHTDVLARAGGHELTIEQAANLLIPYDRIPPQPEVVDAVANLWVDYTLLALAAAKDSTLAGVDLDPVLSPYFNQQLVFQLRDRVIKPDTVFSETQLRELYTREQPGAEVKARHILVRLPADATPAHRDSVLALTRQIRDRARAGEDFAALAAQYSQEPGAAERGGDLGYFTSGQMVQPFEQAAFALQPGEVSDVVETAFGLHVIKVEDKRLPNFDEASEQFRQQMVQKRYTDAEETYLTQLTNQKRLDVQDGAIEVARDLARKPETRLGRRAGARPLVRYQNGDFTAAEYLSIMRTRPAQQRMQITQAPDDDLREWLRLLARDEILIAEAAQQGITVAQTEQDSLRTQARMQLIGAAQAAGLLPLEVQAGESQAQAIDRAVMTLLERILKQETSVVPLGPVGYSLREEFDAEIFERAVPQVVSQVQAARPATPQGALPDMPQPPMPTPPPQQ